MGRAVQIIRYQQQAGQYKSMWTNSASTPPQLHLRPRIRVAENPLFELIQQRDFEKKS